MVMQGEFMATLSVMVDITINYADSTPQNSMRISSDDFEKRVYNFRPNNNDYDQRFI